MTLDTALTVKYNFSLPRDIYHTQEEMLFSIYEAFLQHLRGLGCKVIEWIYEEDKHDLMHLHGILRLPSCFGSKPFGQAWDSRYDLLRMPGFHVKCEKITTIANWKTYMYKDNIRKQKNPNIYFRPGVSMPPNKLLQVVQLGWELYDKVIEREIQKLMACRSMGGLDLLERLCHSDITLSFNKCFTHDHPDDTLSLS